MKTKLSLTLLLSLVFYLLSSQVPQGFNYQAIARDGSGEILADKNMKVIIELRANSETGTLLWQEWHGVTSDQFGLISLVAGNGTRTGGLPVFTDIDWSVQTVFLKTSVEYPVGTTPLVMGTTQIWAVPYSLVAKDVEGPVEKLGVVGTTTNNEEALFEVRNKDGQIVFAVYNEGIRAYVNEIDAKGAKGGFAIGSFGTTKEGEEPQDLLFVSGDSVRVYIDNADLDPVKGPKGGFAIGGFGAAKKGPQQFLTVSNDSVRIYVDNNETDKGAKGGFAIGGYGTDKGKPQKLLTVSNDSVRIYINDGAKGPKGGFAIGGFDQAKGDGANVNFFNIETDNTGIVSPAEPRILWYPLKNAFLAGQVLILKPDSVGMNSVATGFESRAKGAQSQAMGYQAIARGDFSTAIGKNAVAHKANSFAFGENAYAGNVGSFALGIGSRATGLGSFALGFEGRDSANNLTGATVATGTYSMSFGMGAKSTSKGSLAVGTMAEASYEYSTAIGYQSKAENWYATAVGYKTRAIGKYSSAFGFTSRADGEAAVALGRSSAGGKLSVAMGDTYAGGSHSVTMGNASVAFGSSAIAAGYENSAVGNYSAAFGNGTFANGEYSFSSGYATTAEADYANAIGKWNIGYESSGDALFNPLFEVGNGTGPTVRSNVISVLRNGKVVMGIHNLALLTSMTEDNDPPHTLNIRGQGTPGDYHGLYVQGEILADGNLMPAVINSFSIGSSSAPWNSVYSSRYYGNGSTATIYANMIPSATSTYALGSSTVKWNAAHVNTYYGNTSNVATFAASIVPSGTRDIGSSTAYWSNIYGTSYSGSQLSLSGSAGIGTAPGTYKLSVLSTASGLTGSSGYFENTNASGIAMVAKTNSSDGTALLVQNGSGYLLRCDGYDPSWFVSFIVKGRNVGINNDSPSTNLDVNGNGRFRSIASGAYYGVVNRTSDGTLTTATSDMRLKENIETISGGLDAVMKLRGITFTWIDDPGMGKRIGLIAQEVESVLPELVFTNHIDGYKGVNYAEMSAVLIEAVKEQQAQIESQQKQIDQLIRIINEMK